MNNPNNEPPDWTCSTSPSTPEEHTAELESLRARYAELEAAYAALKQDHEAQKTAWTQLETQVGLLREQLMHNEKLASLGRLLAGIAHEINSPLATVKSSADSLTENTAEFLEEHLDFFRQMPESAYRQFRTLLTEALKRQTHLSSREERRHRVALQALLEEMGIATARNRARMLVQLGITAEQAEHLRILQQEDAQQLLRALSALIHIQHNVRNIETAADRTVHIVYALKSYGRKNVRETPVPVVLRESIELILTLFHAQFRDQVELNTELDERVTVFADPDTLAQIWTNIIQNALQAMGERGRLEIRVYAHQEVATVEITDSGPGIPEEVQEQIFDPFFTTKSGGEGSGLGLSICQDIVEQYAGSIDFMTRPGRTTFYIKFPVWTPPDSPAPIL